MIDRHSDFRSEWTEVDGISVHAMVSAGPEAAGDPLLLLHGLGLSHRYMMPTAERLASHFQVYVPDLPGFGESGHPDGVPGIPGLADWLVAWMNAAGLERAAMLGNSQACQIILDLAARHPARISRGVLQGPTTPPEERSWFWQAIRWRRNQSHNPKALGPLTWPEYRKSGYVRVLRTFHVALRDRPEEKAPHVRTPMLVVRGECDPICHQGWAELLARLLSEGRIELIPNAAHTLVFTAPDELAAVTRQFLQEGV